MDEERLRAQQELQMLDLGTARREYVTTIDKPLPREFRLSKAELLQSRVVNQEGSSASQWYQENKTAINAWQKIGETIGEDVADKEQLQDIMGGQSHRARLNKDIQQQGGQAYGEQSATGKTRGFGQGKRAGTDSCVSATSGRGLTTHLPVGNGSTHPSIVPSLPNTVSGPRSDRPLDPAVDPNREYGYKTKRGGKAVTLAYGSGPQLPASSVPGSKAEHLRGTIAASNLRGSSAASSRSKLYKPEASVVARTPRREPPRVMLDDKAFLEAVKEAKITSKFREHIPDRPKLAPASKPAALLDQQRKIFHKVYGSPKKPSQAQTGLHDESKEQCQQQSQVLTQTSELAAETGDEISSHQLSLLPPITPTIVQGNKRSGRAAKPAVKPANFRAQNPVSTGPMDDRTSKKSSSGTVANQHRSSPRAEPQAENDLLMFNDDGDPFRIASKAQTHRTPQVPVAKLPRAPNIPDLLSQEPNGELSHASLTPTSTAPRWITYRGMRYIRADQATSQVPGSGSRLPPVASHKATPEKVFHDARLDIASQILQQGHVDTNTPVHQHLPAESRASTETSSSIPSSASALAKARRSIRPENGDLGQPPPHVLDRPVTPREQQQQKELSPTCVQDTALPVGPVSSRRFSEQVAAVTDFDASEHTPTFSQLDTTSIQHERSSDVAAASGIRAVSPLQPDTPLLDTACEPQHTRALEPRAIEAISRMPSSVWAEPAGGPSMRNSARETDGAKTASVTGRNAPNLSGSIWGRPDAKVITLFDENKAAVKTEITTRTNNGKAAEEAKPVLPAAPEEVRAHHTVSIPSPSQKPDPRAYTFVPVMSERSGNVPRTHDADVAVAQGAASTSSSHQSSPKPVAFEPRSVEKPVQPSPSENSQTTNPTAVAAIKFENQPNPPGSTQADPGLSSSKWATFDDSDSTERSGMSRTSRSEVKAKLTTKSNLPVVWKRGSTFAASKRNVGRVDSDSESGEL